MSNKPIPLDALEMVELLWAAYPERFEDESDENWDAALQLIEELQGFDDLADLLGRVATLTMPLSDIMNGAPQHALGKIEISGNQAIMTAIVKRERCAGSMTAPNAKQNGARMEADLWRCTVCGRIGTVGRCCGEETREPVRGCDE